MNDVKLEVKGTKLDLANLLSASTLGERISDFDGDGALGVSQQARLSIPKCVCLPNRPGRASRTARDWTGERA
jgi:hypothetical protein